MKRTSFLLLLPFLIISTAFGGTDAPVKGVRGVQLKNGLTAIIIKDRSHPIVSVQTWVKVGSVNENATTAGLSHFLEHLIFKGTEKYPAQEISRRVETQGGTINAGTSKEFTHFYIDIQKSAYADAVRILADAMANAVLPADEIEKERPVVIEEIRRHGDNPGAVLYDLYNEAVFPAAPYRSSIIGTEEVIRNVTRREIADYYRKHYVPGNMVVSIAGDIDEKEALALVGETFGKQPPGPVPPEPELVEKPHPPRAASETKDVEQTYWMGGFLGPVIVSDDQFAADVTASILGGGRSSRLFRKLREEKQLVYSIGASFWSQRGSGIFTVSAVFPAGREEDVAREITHEIERLMNEGPTDDELQRAKGMIESQWYFGKETFHEQAALVGYWQLQGNPRMVERYIPGVAETEKADVREFLKKYYTPQGVSRAVITPAVSPGPE